MNSSTSVRTFYIPEENMKSKNNQKQKNDEEKMNDPNFIFNPTTKRFIKSTSSVAKRLLDSYTLDQLKSLAIEHKKTPSTRKASPKSSSNDNSSNSNESSLQICKINCISSDQEINKKVDQFTHDYDNDSSERRHREAVNNDIKVNMMRDGATVSRDKVRIRENERPIQRRPTLDSRSLNTIEIGRKILEQRKLIRENNEKNNERIKEKINETNKKEIDKNLLFQRNEKKNKNMKDLCNRSGGIGVYFGPGDDNNLSEKFKEYPVTNQRAEVWAIMKALQIAINDQINLDPHLKIVIYTDSMYAMNVITKAWKAKENLDLINKAWKLFSQFNNLEIKHIRAHTNKKDSHSIGNSMADRLALAGKDKD
jgi:ribonuclease HI